MNYLERSITDTGFSKIASEAASPNYGRMAYNLAAAPFRVGSKIYNSVGDRAQNHMLAGGGLFAAGAIGAPYAGQAYTSATSRISRLGGKRYNPIRGKYTYRSPFRQRFRAGKNLMLGGLGAKAMFDYARGMDKGTITSWDALGGAAGIGAGFGAGYRLAGRRGAGIGAAIGLGAKMFYDYKKGKV